MRARDFALLGAVLAVETVVVTALIVHFVFGTAGGRLLLCYAGG